MPQKESFSPSAAATAAGIFVAYYRVSTERQGVSGLGIDAQISKVAEYVAGAGGMIRHRFEEHESGRRSDRPELAAALAVCRKEKATLIVAKIDRLARNARFLLSVAEGVGEGGVVFCDLPILPPGPMGKFFLTLMAAVAELESGLISDRTKAALAAAKARGVKLGNANMSTVRGGRAASGRRSRAKVREVAPYVKKAMKAGASSLSQIAEALNNLGVKTPSGKGAWMPEQVRRVVKAMETVR